MVDVRSRAAAKLGVTVSKIRKRADVTPKLLADRSGIDLSYIGRIERGQTNVTLHMLIQLATALDVDPAEFFAGITAADLPPDVRPFSEAEYRRELRRRTAQA